VTKKLTKKEQWIKTEHDRIVQIHWDNLDRIRDLESDISAKMYQIYDLQKSYNKLDCYDTDKYVRGTIVVRQEQIKLAKEIAEMQCKIDENPFEKSCKIMQADSNEKTLAEKYDRLFTKEVAND